MARTAKGSRTMKAAAKPRKTGRAAPAVRTSAKARTAAPPPAPKRNKEEMRVQLEKLEKAHATLRTKNREAVKAAKAASATIAELHDRIAALEAELAARPAHAEPVSDPKPRRVRRAPVKDSPDIIPVELPPATTEPAAIREPDAGDVTSDE